MIVEGSKYDFFFLCFFYVLLIGPRLIMGWVLICTHLRWGRHLRMYCLQIWSVWTITLSSGLPVATENWRRRIRASVALASDWPPPFWPPPLTDSAPTPRRITTLRPSGWSPSPFHLDSPRRCSPFLLPLRLFSFEGKLASSFNPFRFGALHRLSWHPAVGSDGLGFQFGFLAFRARIEFMLALVASKLYRSVGWSWVIGSIQDGSNMLLSRALNQRLLGNFMACHLN